MFSRETSRIFAHKVHSLHCFYVLSPIFHQHWLSPQTFPWEGIYISDIQDIRYEITWEGFAQSESSRPNLWKSNSGHPRPPSPGLCLVLPTWTSQRTSPLCGTYCSLWGSYARCLYNFQSFIFHKPWLLTSARPRIDPKLVKKRPIKGICFFGDLEMTRNRDPCLGHPQLLAHRLADAGRDVPWGAVDHRVTWVWSSWEFWASVVFTSDFHQCSTTTETSVIGNEECVKHIFEL